MGRVFRAHVVAHLRFFRRNRIVLALAAGTVLLMGFSAASMAMWSTDTSRFESLRQVVEIGHSIISFFGAWLGLVALAVHRRDRNLKMIFTKPWPTELWLGALVTAAAIVVAAAHAVVVSMAYILSLFWGIAFPLGFVLLGLKWMLASTLSLAALTFLATFLHPAIAVGVTLFFGEDMIHILRTMAASVGEEGARPLWVELAERLLEVLYWLSPGDPFGRALDEVGRSLRVSGEDWTTLVLFAAYATVATIFFALAGHVLLRRSTHI